MNLQLLKKYIDVAIDNDLMLPNTFWKPDKIIKCSFYIKDEHYKMEGDNFFLSLYITNSTRTYQIHPAWLITSKNFIESVSKGIYPLWHYRDMKTCYRDIIEKQALAIYKDNFDDYIIETLKLNKKDYDKNVNWI